MTSKGDLKGKIKAVFGKMFPRRAKVVDDPAAHNATGLAYLGVIRFILASNVALFHIWTTVAPDAGRHSVIGFFCLSGFLVTKIAVERYAGRPLAYLVNRALRLYPAYLVCCALTVLIVHYYPAVAAGPDFPTTLPTSVASWGINLSILGLSPAAGFERIISPAWTLGIEMCFYLIIGLATYVSVPLTAVLFLGSLVVGVASIFHVSVLSVFGVVSSDFYFSAYGDAFLFFAGSLAYFVTKTRKIPKRAVLAAMAVYAVSCYGLPHLMTIPDYAGPWPNLFLLISAAAVWVMLAGIEDFRCRNKRFVAISNYMGKLSYPIFLLHWGVAMPFCAKFGARNGLEFITAYVATLLLSAVVVEIADRPIEHLRGRIRGLPSR